MEKLSLLPVPDILEHVISLPSNNICVDCNDQEPDWASLGFGILICLNCAGYHRSLGTHITLVRSIRLDSWSSDQIRCLELGGNELFKKYIKNYSAQDNQMVVSENDSMKFDHFQKYSIPEVLYYREVLSSRIETRDAIPFSKSDYDEFTQHSPKSPQSKIDKVFYASWIPDHKTNHCMLCMKQFSMFIRRHHCRKCGRVTCSDCAPTDNVRPILEIGMKNPVRHCKECFKSPIVNWKN